MLVEPHSRTKSRVTTQCENYLIQLAIDHEQALGRTSIKDVLIKLIKIFFKVCENSKLT